MDLAHPYRAVCPSLDGDVLDVLARTTMAMTGRQIAVMTGRRSHSGVMSVLNRLVAHGLVQRVELNRAALYAINREHLAWPAVEALTTMRRRLAQEITIEVERWTTQPVHVSLFGSAARGDGTIGSDIDVLIVRNGAIAASDAEWRAQVSRLERRIERLSGNEAVVVDKTVAELLGLQAAGRPALETLVDDSLLLYGPPIEALTGTR